MLTVRNVTISIIVVQTTIIDPTANVTGCLNIMSQIMFISILLLLRNIKKEHCLYINNALLSIECPVIYHDVTSHIVLVIDNGSLGYVLSM